MKTREGSEKGYKMEARDAIFEAVSQPHHKISVYKKPSTHLANASQIRIQKTTQQS